MAAEDKSGFSARPGDVFTGEPRPPLGLFPANGELMELDALPPQSIGLRIRNMTRGRLFTSILYRDIFTTVVVTLFLSAGG